MTPDTAFEARQLDEAWVRVLAELPRTCRNAFVLVRYGQVSYKVAGDQLGLTPSAICAHVVTARRHLRRRLKEQGIAITYSRPNSPGSATPG